MEAINPQASPFLLSGNTDTACLFIHGFTASPSEVYPVGQLLHGMTGCTVSGPLLPGHGCSPQDLNQTCWQDWFFCIEQELESLQELYSRVFIAGLSMGGLLALHAASKIRGLNGVIAINTPIITKFPLQMAAAPLIRYFRPFHPKKIGSADEEMVEEGRFAYPVMPIKALISMKQLRKIVIREISALNLPILLFQSLLDESINPNSAEYIKERAGQVRVRLVELRNSGHIATMGPEKLTIAEEMARFMTI